MALALLSAGRTPLLTVLRLLSLLTAVAVGSFVLMVASPVDPVKAYVGAEGRNLGPEQLAQIEERWGLGDPPMERFLAWSGNVLTGDFGQSQIYGEPVLTVIGERFMTSLLLLATAWLLAGVLGFAFGVVAGVNQGRVTDRVLSWWAYVLASAPTFWVGLVLLYFFAVSLQWAPVCCAAPIGVEAADATLLQRLEHVALPALTLSLVGVSPILLHTRQATIEVLASDHVAFARLQGESTTGIVVHRVLRNAAGPALMLQFASVGELFGGAVLAETVFTYPGLGQATTEAALRQDVPLLLGIAIFTAIFVFVGNALGDLAHRVADPRVREVTTA